MKAYKNCCLCPRLCRTDRSAGKTGFCRMTAETSLCLASLHFGEEPPVTGEGGSGTLFFAGCTLQCSFCQNGQLSHQDLGSVVSDEELAGIMLRLQEAGAENINLVTGTHFIPGIRAALDIARGRKMALPLVWNTSSYDLWDAVSPLHNDIQYYLTDLKTLNPETAMRFYHAPDYPGVASRFILQALENLNSSSGAVEGQGLILRHLVMPGMLGDTEQVIKWYADNAQGRAHLSLMMQYTPVKWAPDADIPDRKVTGDEFDVILDMLDRYGIEEGFIQEPSEETVWLPDFSRADSFPARESRVLWHRGNLTDIP